MKSYLYGVLAAWSLAMALLASVGVGAAMKAGGPHEAYLGPSVSSATDHRQGPNG